jgi:hypothetical protein
VGGGAGRGGASGAAAALAVGRQTAGKPRFLPALVCPSGAGQDIMDSSGPKGTDASGNPILQVRAARHPRHPTLPGLEARAARRPARLPLPCLLDNLRRPPMPLPCPRLPQDIGVFLRDVFRKRFKGVDVKYIGAWHSWHTAGQQRDRQQPGPCMHQRCPRVLALPTVVVCLPISLLACLPSLLLLLQPSPWVSASCTP